VVSSPGCQAPIIGVNTLPPSFHTVVNSINTATTNISSSSSSRGGGGGDGGGSGGGGGVGAMIVSPSGPGRTHLAVTVASKAANFTDWTQVGLLDNGDAGYSSLLAASGAGAWDGAGSAGSVDAGSKEEFLVLYETNGTRACTLLRFSL
jgi:hypothetical protein